ncbi:EamA family transporter RarD [Piscinibacter sp.]|uniref:EamA family transporter RarD n=1 Tax=Piscinibacter sp. TaxID=1903157 RepID=UPI002C224B92|nr:EamA family transporter RarD [Albitalea sp.]HUG21453.1 EamA family transporter RarD [Albitalea sp.]
MHPGIASAALAYVCWGLFPLYFKQLAEVAALEVLAHRVVWSLLFLLVVLTVRRQWAWWRQALRQPKVLGAFAFSALLLSANWLTYIWAVTHGHVVDASLGYFITPLVNVLLGYTVLHERLRPLQWTAVALAGVGVLWLAVQGGELPWIALVLACTFGAYGLLRKTASLGALEGLALETMLLAPAAFALLGWGMLQGSGSFPSADSSTNALLIGIGPVTAIPLLLFAAGARRIPLSTLGLLQYLAPSIQFVLGIWLFHEAFTPTRFVGFCLIWLALAIYSAEGWLRTRTPAAPVLTPDQPKRTA